MERKNGNEGMNGEKKETSKESKGKDEQENGKAPGIRFLITIKTLGINHVMRTKIKRQMTTKEPTAAAHQDATMTLPTDI